MLATANILLFLLVTVLLAAGQTSFWLQLFGSFPPPALWMPVLVYLALYRTAVKSVLLAYLIAIALTPTTTMPESLFMISCALTALGIQKLKNRIYWTTTTYFMMVAGLATAFFHLIYFTSTWVLNIYPITSPNIAGWIVQSFLTPLFAPLFVPIFRWIDLITQHTESAEVAGAYHS